MYWEVLKEIFGQFAHTYVNLGFIKDIFGNPKQAMLDTFPKRIQYQWKVVQAQLLTIIIAFIYYFVAKKLLDQGDGVKYRRQVDLTGFDEDVTKQNFKKLGISVIIYLGSWYALVDGRGRPKTKFSLYQFVLFVAFVLSSL